MLTMGGLIACTMLAGRAMAPLAQLVGPADAVPERPPGR
jgi:ABC-type bacteriocin/lantibiotic exporter with double-glycine peptidase domain